VGFGFFTVDFAPTVRGYKGEIWMLIGMDPGGNLTENSVVYHDEPFGYFSIDATRPAAPSSRLARRTPRRETDCVPFPTACSMAR